MAISSLRIEDFRNLAKVELHPCQIGLNIICGMNGSGKTSLLEAIHYLGIGRSFRSSVSNRLIRYESSKFSVFSQLVNQLERTIPAGVERHTNGVTRFRIDEKDTASIAELAQFLPIRVINSSSHHLFESGPIYRRKFLDWGLFYHTDHFLQTWRYFERALKQRNAVIRERRSRSELDVWTQEFTKHSVEMDRMRRDYISQLQPFINEAANTLLTLKNFQIEYLPGWDESSNLAELLANSYLDEMRAGHSIYGPHRADLDITVEGVPVKHILSRGQQKLLICAMILAQGMLLKQANKSLIYLIDDLPSELDSDSRHKLIGSLAAQQSQIFITAIEKESICDLISKDSDVLVKVFHVEHGQVVEMAGKEPN